MTQPNRRSRRRRIWPPRRDGRRKNDKLSFVELYLQSESNKQKPQSSNEK